MKEVKILEVEKEVLKRIDMICRFACANGQLLEIHWVEHKKYGRYKGKIKNVLNKESYQNRRLLSFLLSKEDK